MDNFIAWLPFLASLLVVVGGWWFSRHKQSADIVSELTEAAKNLLIPLNDRINKLEQLVKGQEKELELLRPLPRIVEALTRGVHILITQIRRLGCEPDWTPEGITQPVKNNKRKPREA